MSTVVVFTPAGMRRTRRADRPANVIPLAAARTARTVPAPMAPTGRAPLRLTRRGQVVVAALAAIVLVIAMTAGVLLIGRQALAGDRVQPVPASYHIVLPGETLWSIAGQVAPGADRRDAVARIVEFNALTSAGVQAGQRVAIPGDLGGH